MRAGGVTRPGGPEVLEAADRQVREGQAALLAASAELIA
jgi:hypothetical protein